MKNVMMSLLLTLAAFSASAENLSVDTQKLGNLPEVRVTGITVDPGPAMAAVQPTAALNFQMMSCAKVPVEVSTQEVGNVILVTIEYMKTAVDCMGPVRAHDYSAQISSDFLNQRVVVLNPVLHHTSGWGF